MQPNSLKVTPANGFILVENDDKVKKAHQGGFVIPKTSNNLGVVVLSNDERVVVGQSVYYAGAYERALIESKDLLILKYENIVGFVQE